MVRRECWHNRPWRGWLQEAGWWSRADFCLNKQEWNQRAAFWSMRSGHRRSPWSPEPAEHRTSQDQCLAVRAHGSGRALRANWQSPLHLKFRHKVYFRLTNPWGSWTMWRRGSFQGGRNWTYYQKGSSRLQWLTRKTRDVTISTSKYYASLSGCRIKWDKIYYDKQVDSQKIYSSLVRETDIYSFSGLLRISCVSEPGPTVRWNKCDLYTQGVFQIQ